MTRFVYSPRYAVDIGGHVFPTAKFRLTAEAVAERGKLVEPSEPARSDLLLAHDAAWVDKVLSCRMTLEDETLMELPFTPEVSLAHRLQAAGTVLACRWAMQDGVGLHIGGGSHHAFRDHGEGFCVLNDIALAMLQMRREGRVRRAAVIDLDVHQGNGTASILAGDADFFTFSMHQQDIYPEVKQRSSLDVELAAGTGDAEYLARLAAALPRVFAHRPDLVIYQAGVDVWERDLLGGLKLSERGILARDSLVREECRRHGVPAAVTLGGGYGQDVRDTARLHARTLLAFSEGQRQIS
ncbi:MAG: histone deacetylase [Elusimicrobia bacterium]|nr:histone deacetylase [Elusimicrobiota bacterium]